MTSDYININLNAVKKQKLLRACLYGGGLARYPGWPALPRSHLHKKFDSITYNVLSCVYMRAGPARSGKIPPLLTRDLR